MVFVMQAQQVNCNSETKFVSVTAVNFMFRIT